tara:strand:- start:1237 stop:1410 length:174 start_codon:yes stop_codon:yes gene_type:complete
LLGVLFLVKGFAHQPFAPPLEINAFLVFFFCQTNILGAILGGPEIAGTWVSFLVRNY